MGFKTDWQVGNIITVPKIKKTYSKEYPLSSYNVTGINGDKEFDLIFEIENAISWMIVQINIDNKVYYAAPGTYNNNIVKCISNIKVNIPNPFVNKDFKAIVQIKDATNKLLASNNYDINVDLEGKVKINGVTTKDNENKSTANYCNCNDFVNLFKCTRYKTVFGPLYMGSQSMVSFDWSILISTGKINNDEKEILVSISENEGNFDAVQSYDSEIITVGAMQKTMNPEGTGELPTQINEFKASNPTKYKELFENCGWIIKIVKGKASLVYKDLDTGTIYNNKDLKKKIREGYISSKFTKIVPNKYLAPFIKAGRDNEFQAKQVTDFITRLNIALNLKPAGYKFKIKDYLKSNFGKAVVLDHSVNRPGHVTQYFGEVLKRFYVKYPNAPESPYLWGAKQQEYENWIIQCYGPLRGVALAGVKSPMTDAVKRFEKIKDKFQ